MSDRRITCCFSGYRAEKMPFSPTDHAAVTALQASLRQAILEATAAGYTRFLSGMSTGFDLWAAQAVLQLQQEHSIALLCAVPFDRQADRFPMAWKQLFNTCLLHAEQVFALSRAYHSGCYAVRNQFMVDSSSRLICYYDGRPGGTMQTIHMAQRAELTICNLADFSLS